MSQITIHDLHDKLTAKEISAVELTKQMIAHRDAAEGEIHAYLSVSDEAALARAAAVDARIAAGSDLRYGRDPRCGQGQYLHQGRDLHRSLPDAGTLGGSVQRHGH